MQFQSTTWRPHIEEPGAQTGMVPGAIYDRASDDGGYVYSQQEHFNKVRDLFHKHGVYVAMYRYDDKSGAKVNRKGYQDILCAVELGQVAAIGVDKMDRLGRRGWERLRVLEECDKRHVPVYVAEKERSDEGGILRYVEAWKDEEYLREVARKTLGQLPHAVRAGKHPMKTPIGYRRAYPEGQAFDPRVRSVMVADPDYAPLVQEMFRAYEAGTPVREIARQLNQGPLPNPRAGDGRWSQTTVYGILRRKTYLGVVEWGKRPKGEWGRYKGPVLTEKGQHPALIEPDLFARVQTRLDRDWRRSRVNERGRPLSLLSGLLKCPACGERMYVHHRRVDGALYGQYYCASRAKGKSDCQGTSISETLADEAVLREVVRLERRPWDPGRFDQTVQADPNAGLRRRLTTELADAKAELQDNARAYAAAGDFSPEVTDAFRAVAQPISLKIRHLEDQLATLPQQTVDTVRAKEVHDILASHEIADFVRGAQERGDSEVLRDILRTCVLRAWISERGSATGTGRSARWAKATVEWTAEVQLLLASGHLTLGPEAEVPGRKSERELAAERARRYRARKRERASGTLG